MIKAGQTGHRKLNKESMILALNWGFFPFLGNNFLNSALDYIFLPASKKVSVCTFNLIKKKNNPQQINYKIFKNIQISKTKTNSKCKILTLKDNDVWLGLKHHSSNSSIWKAAYTLKRCMRLIVPSSLAAEASSPFWKPLPCFNVDGCSSPAFKPLE